MSGVRGEEIESISSAMSMSFQALFWRQTARILFSGRPQSGRANAILRLLVLDVLKLRDRNRLPSL